MLLLPQPLGPTMAETPGGKSMPTFSTKDLNPVISIFFSLMDRKSPLLKTGLPSLFRGKGEGSG